MKQYLDLMRRVRDEGTRKDDRTGTGTLSVFGHQMRFDLGRGFPAVTTKKLHFRSIIHELLWFLRGDTNTQYLVENGVTIWDEWADDDGELGPVYGRQWRAWPTPDGGHIDQIARVVEQLKTNPDSRRIIVNAWNVGQLGEMALSLYAANEGFLDDVPVAKVVAVPGIGPAKATKILAALDLDVGRDERVLKDLVIVHVGPVAPADELADRLCAAAPYPLVPCGCAVFPVRVSGGKESFYDIASRWREEMHVLISCGRKRHQHCAWIGRTCYAVVKVRHSCRAAVECGMTLCLKHAGM